MKRSRALVTFISLLSLIGCGGANSYVKKGEIQKTITQQAETSRYIEALGIGAADTTLQNTTQRRATSRDAAIVQAQYEMLSYIKGVQLEGGVTVVTVGVAIAMVCSRSAARPRASSSPSGTRMAFSGQRLQDSSGRNRRPRASQPARKARCCS